MKRRNALILTALTFMPALSMTSCRTNAMKKELQLDAHPEQIEPFSLDNVEWKMRLEEDAYYVLRKEGTERPFTSPLNDEKRDGEFA